MTEYRKTAVLFGPEGPLRGAPLDFANRKVRDMFWCEFNRVDDGQDDGNALWRKISIGAPVNALIATGFQVDTLIPGSVGIIDPGTAAAASGLHVGTYSAAFPTISREFEFGYSCLYRVRSIANAFSFVGLGGPDAAALNTSGAYVTASNGIGLLLETDRELRLRASGVNTLIRTGVPDGTWLELEMHGALTISSAQLINGKVEVYLDGTLIREINIAPSGGDMNSISLVTLGVYGPVFSVVRLVGASSVMDVDYVGRWHTRR